jgi:exodeoxyribonuclease VII large subunit
MFRGAAQGLGFEPKDGQKVILFAKASLYDRDGKFQLYVNSMKMDGIGDLYLAFEQLKNRLFEEGLFDSAHKKKIPMLPRKIGVVTSPSGAVIRDIIHVLTRRFPDFCLVLMPAQVQGTAAAQTIVSALEELNRRNDIDVIIIGRGGGSLEDLWCFNEESVARAVFLSKIPVISAVGHETDYTICDFVADERAPTPSAAAELVMPIKSECTGMVRQQMLKMKKLLENKLEYEKLKWTHLARNKVFLHPEGLYDRKREEIDYLSESCRQSMLKTVHDKTSVWNLQLQRLDGLSPLKTLQRGYGVPQRVRDRSVIHSIKDTRVGDEFLLRLTDGELDCSILSIKE